MVDEIEVKELSNDYVLAMSNNDYNPQTIANTNILKDFGKGCNKYRPYKVRDFVYKNDYFTPRNVYLINPLYYTFYTYLVFSIVYTSSREKSIFDFSRKQMRIFYSGLLDIRLNQKEIKRNARYNSSYKMYQEEREKHLGKPALKIDLIFKTFLIR
jgi:hypothetical protein